LPRQVQFCDAIENARDCRESLGTLPFGNQQYGELFFQRFADRFEDAWLRYKKKRADKAGPFKVLFDVLD
jgi:hypothetical protein